VEFSYNDTPSRRRFVDAEPWRIDSSSQGRLNQRAHWARAQGPRSFLFLRGPQLAAVKYFFKLIILLMLLHDRTNTSSAYLVNLHTAVQGYCTGSVLLSLLYCVFCFAKINCKGNAVNILARGPVRLRGAQGPSAGKDGTGSGLLLSD